MHKNIQISTQWCCKQSWEHWSDLKSLLTWANNMRSILIGKPRLCATLFWGTYRKPRLIRFPRGQIVNPIPIRTTWRRKWRTIIAASTKDWELRGRPQRLGLVFAWLRPGYLHNRPWLWDDQGPKRRRHLLQNHGNYWIKRNHYFGTYKNILDINVSVKRTYYRCQEI